MTPVFLQRTNGCFATRMYILWPISCRACREVDLLEHGPAESLELELLRTSCIESHQTSKMNTATSRRAGARLVAFLTSPAAKVTEQSLYRRAIYSRNLRFASSTTRRWQQSTPPSTTSPSPSHPSQTPLPTQATQKPSPSASQPTQNATAEKVQHELSPSDESEPLRALDEPPPAFDADSNQVDWTRSFQGLSSTPFTSEQAAILQQEIAFDDIEIKPDGIIYLPEIKYRRILNRAFGPGGWGLAPRGETIVTDRLVTREYGLVAGGRYAPMSPITRSLPN